MAKTEKIKYIRLTRKAIGEMFDECNQLYFNNSIERPYKFETWTPWKKTMAMVRPTESLKPKPLHEQKSILHISGRYRWTKENLRKVMVHEMIHLAIEDYKEPRTFLQRLPFVGGLFQNKHDSRFVAMMNELNEKYDLGITIYAKFMRSELIR